MSRSTHIRRRWVLVTGLLTAMLTCTLAGPAQAKPAAADPTLTDSYTAVGSSHIGSINATLPISKTALVETLDLNTFAITGGTLPIAPQTVSFKALGFIPLRATVSLTQVSPITGSITPGDDGNTVKTSVAYTIRLSNVQVQFLGSWQSLQVGNNCQTIKPAVITAATPTGGSFDISDGGVLTGSYTIGNFQNCAPLRLPDLFGIGSLPVNSLVPGSKNTVSITLSDGTFVSGT